jgi:hypothetical protein
VPDPFVGYPDEIKERARELWLGGGRSKRSIAQELGVSPPTLGRWLADAAPAGEPSAAGGQPASDGLGDQIVADIMGRRKREPKGDPQPRATKGATPPPAATKGVSDAQLTEALSEMLCFPAIPMAMVFHCDYCAAHFAATGGPAATELVRLSQTSAGLRSALERIYGIYKVLMTGGILAMYAGKPLIHHLAPADALALAGPLLGIPPRPNMVNHAGVYTAPVHSNGDGPAHPADTASEGDAAGGAAAA